MFRFYRLISNFIKNKIPLESNNVVLIKIHGNSSCRLFSSECGSNKGVQNACNLNIVEEIVTKINHQINMELYAGYVYLGMAYFFDKSSVALQGFKNTFLKFSEEEMEHARSFMNYQNLRGGNIILENLKSPENTEWSPKKAIITALELEKQVTKCILELHVLADKHKDAHFSSYLEEMFIDEQYEAIRQLCELSTQLDRVGDKEGLHILDNELQKKYIPTLKVK